MAKFTKEQLTKHINDMMESSKEMIGGNGVPVEFVARAERDICVYEIALAALTAEPVLYCMEGDTLDEENVSTSKAVVDAWVEEWNGEGRCPGEPVYQTVALYRLPEVK